MVGGGYAFGVVFFPVFCVLGYFLQKVLMTANDFHLQSSVTDFSYWPNSSQSDYALPTRMSS